MGRIGEFFFSFVLGKECGYWTYFVDCDYWRMDLKNLHLKGHALQGVVAKNS